jgi:hypothetical protein
MYFRRSTNDAILHPFLSARDAAESEGHLAILISKHAEPLSRYIIMSRLHSYFGNYDRHPDFEDLYSDVKTRLVTYLEELKAGRTAGPCKDIRSYVAGIAHNACNNYLREIYPARTRLHKQVRDLLGAHPDFAIWKQRDETDRTYWACGFDCWQGDPCTSKAEDWEQQFYENPGAIAESLAGGNDLQLMDLDDLLVAIFNQVEGPIALDTVVSIIADIRGIKDMPTVSFDNDEDDLARNLSDSNLRIDTVLEMREPLKLFWEGLCQLPRKQFKAYILYARDSSGEDLISLFISAKIATEAEIAQLLDLPLEEFRDLWLKRLPLDNETIAREIGVKLKRVYKLRSLAGNRLRKFLSEKRIKI